MITVNPNTANANSQDECWTSRDATPSLPVFSQAGTSYPRVRRTNSARTVLQPPGLVSRSTHLRTHCQEVHLDDSDSCEHRPENTFYYTFRYPATIIPPKIPLIP